MRFTYESFKSASNGEYLVKVTDNINGRSAEARANTEEVAKVAAIENLYRSALPPSHWHD